jgi:NAD(P)-dependent dehydrogenase (short-subunit alcohol dehydrogenase family)
VVFDDIAFRFRPYDPITAYGQSKTAQVLLGVEAHHRWSDDGIRVHALHPGAIATNLQKHTGRAQDTGAVPQDPGQGCCDVGVPRCLPTGEGIGGRYFEDVNEAPVVTERPTGFGVPGVAAYAIDLDNAARLWAPATDILR